MLNFLVRKTFQIIQLVNYWNLECEGQKCQIGELEGCGVNEICNQPEPDAMGHCDCLENYYPVNHKCLPVNDTNPTTTMIPSHSTEQGSCEYNWIHINTNSIIF